MKIKAKVVAHSEEFNFEWRYTNTIRSNLTLENGVTWSMILDARGLLLIPTPPCNTPAYIKDTWYKWNLFVQSPRGYNFSIESKYLLGEKEPVSTNTQYGHNEYTILLPSAKEDLLTIHECTKITLVCTAYVLTLQSIGRHGYMEVTTRYPYMFIDSPRKCGVLRRTK